MEKANILGDDYSELSWLRGLIFGGYVQGTMGIVWYQNDQNRVTFYFVPQKLWVANFAGRGPLIFIFTYLESSLPGDFKMA